MMNCNEVTTLLADHLGGELSIEQGSALETHLQDCDSCAREVESLQETALSLHQLDTVSLSHAIERTSRFEVVKRQSTVQRFMYASLKMAAVLALGVLLGRASLTLPSNTDGPSTPTSTNGSEQVVAQVNMTAIHPEWEEFARKLNRNPSGLAGSLRHLAKGIQR